MIQRTALVTGLLGQDGSLLAEHLLTHDYRVVGLVRPGAKPGNDVLRAVASRCELIELDFARPPTPRWAFDVVDHVKPDEVYHLAACHRSSESGAGDTAVLQQHMVDVNTSAALALAHAVLARQGSSLVLAGSSQMYTPTLPPPVITPTTTLAPATFYGVTKANALGSVRWLREHQGLRGSTAIMFNHESPRRPAAFVTRKVTRAAARIAAGLESAIELIDVWSRADFSAAADVIVALHAMARADRPTERVIASGRLHTVADVCEVAFAAVGLDWRDHVRSQQPPGDRASLVGDPSETEHDLGWVRARSFEDWIREMVDEDCRLAQSS